MPDDGDGRAPKRNGNSSRSALAAVRRDEPPPAVFTAAGSTDEYVAVIRAKQAARGVPKSQAALEAILGLDDGVMSHEEFAIAVKVAQDRGVIEPVDGGYTVAE